MSKVWGNIGAWAADSERAEAEEKEQAAAAAAAAAASPQSFPSLREAVTTGKGKKKTKMTLQEFTLTGTGTGLTPDEMMRLPTGPKERTSEEMQYGRLGGGFSSYGGGRTGGFSSYGGGRTGGGPRMRDREPDGAGPWGNSAGNSRRSYGGFDGSVARNMEFDQPSRADEVDNWLMVKKTPSFDSGTRPNRYGSLGGSTGGISRADGIDNWTVNKKPVTPVPVRSPSFGSGFRGFEKFEQTGQMVQRRRLVLEPRKLEPIAVEGVTKTNKPNPFGSARPREEILAEKGLDWRKSDMEYEAKRINSHSRPTSSHSNSRPGSAQSGSSVEVSGVLQGVEKPRAKVNPFGDAKPREVLLWEKGVDYRKIDLELERRRLGRPESEAENSLKEEIYNLKRENQTSLHDTILEKERELEQLTRDLDDKLRFAQKTVERPGSGAGRVGLDSDFQERLGSGSGRAVSGFYERPGSGSGRIGSGFYERPGSGSGRTGSGFYERPGSGSGRTGSGFYERPGSGSGRVGPGFYGRPGSGSGRVGPGFYERPGSGSGRVGPGFYERPGSGSGRAGPGFYERLGSGSGRAGSGFYEGLGSGSGRVGPGFYERPPSQSGSFDGSRNVDFLDRPRFRGDFGMSGGDDRRGFVGGRGNRGFLGSRELGRSNSRDRW